MPAKGSTKSSTARKSKAYVDTSALIAFTDRSDTHHTLFRLISSDSIPAPYRGRYGAGMDIVQP